MHNIGDKKKVSAAPTSIYFKFHGETVEIIGVTNIKKGNSEVPVYTFHHPSLGFGAMYEHGLK